MMTRVPAGDSTGASRAVVPSACPSLSSRCQEPEDCRWTDRDRGAARALSRHAPSLSTVPSAAAGRGGTAFARRCLGRSARGSQTRPAQVGLEQRRSGQKCAAQIRAASIGLSQGRLEKSGTGELRVPEIRTQQIRLPEIKAGQVAAASIRASQVAIRPIRALLHGVCGRACRQEQ